MVGAELVGCAIKIDYNGPKALYSYVCILMCPPDLKERFSFDEEFLVSKKEPNEHSRSLDMFGVD